MRNIILKRLLLFSVFAAAIVSCSEQEESTSVYSEFAKYAPGLTATTVTETDGPQVVRVTLDGETQLTDMHITIEVGSSSTAKDGEDFELLTHEVDVLAFQGQDGFDIEIDVFDDFVVGEEDEVIYLTMHTEIPSGLDRTEVLVLTIQDRTPFTEELFSGDYAMTTDNDAFGVPFFDDQTVTLDAVGGNFRVFSAEYLESLGIDAGTEDWVLEFNHTDNLFHMVENPANLSCNAGGILIQPTAPFGTLDLLDDSSFTVEVTEFEPLIDGNECGLDGTVPVTITFTKL